MFSTMESNSPIVPNTRDGGGGEVTSVLRLCDTVRSRSRPRHQCSVQCTNVVPHADIGGVKQATKSESHYWLQLIIQGERK